MQFGPQISAALIHRRFLSLKVPALSTCERLTDANSD
jgi:hypothetical protein